MSIMQLLSVWRARWRAILSVAVFVLVTILLYSLLAAPKYVAETSLLVLNSSSNPLTGLPQYTPPQETVTATQADIIASHGVALKVIDALKWADDKSAQEDFQRETGGKGSIRDWLAYSLEDYVSVDQTRESNVVTISYEAITPELAAAFANAFADAYIETTISMKAEVANRQAAWLNKQVDEQRAVLKQAQEKLSHYQQETKIAGGMNSGTGGDVEDARLEALNKELVLAQAARSDAAARLTQMRSALASGKQDSLIELANNPVVQSLKAELNKTEGELAQATQRYGRSHPQYLASLSQVEKLRSRLNAELTSAQTGIEQAAQQAVRREAEVNAQLAEQRGRMLSLLGKNDQKSRFEREVESAQRAYDMALQRANQVSMEGRDDHSNVVVLSAAVPPLLQAAPRVLLNVALALILGPLLGLAFALVLELRDRRVRSDADLGDMGLLVLNEVNLSALPGLQQRQPWLRLSQFPLVARRSLS